MRHEVLALNGNEKTTLTTYLLDGCAPGRSRPMVVICPGGGFLHCTPNEGECVALHFNRMGFHAAVLRYSTAASAPGHSAFPQPERELAVSLCLLRENAAEWEIDPDRIAVLGFSAGGHVCANYANFWNTDLLSGIGTPAQRKPNAQVLCYPLLTTRQLPDPQAAAAAGVPAPVVERMHNFVRDLTRAMLGTEQPSDAQHTACDALEHIGPDTPPTFLMHTFGDHLIAPDYTLQMTMRLRAAHIPCELHMFEQGEHGLSLADATSATKPAELDPHVAHWAELAGEWLLDHFEKEGEACPKSH